MDGDAALAHPRPVPTPGSALLEGVASRLHRAGLDGHAAAVADLVLPPAVIPGALPVLASLRSALALAPPSDLVDALAVVADGANWTQTASYVDDPPAPDFLDGYAHATIAGPRDGGRRSDDPGRIALGLLLLGPRVDYPRHHHPADEVYLPLTEASWVHGADDDLTRVPPGTVIHHEPWQPHGMRTGDDPLLALYVWTGDVTTPSRFCARAGDRADPEIT